jgi:magnesium transporter
MVETLKIGTLRWYYIPNPSDDDFHWLEKEFYFHPLDIEDCKFQFNQRPKIDMYDDYHFLILHFPYYDTDNKFIKTREIKIFWGQDFIITIGKPHWVVSETFAEGQKQMENNIEFEVASSDALLYAILERLMKSTLNMLKKIGEDIDRSSKQIFEKSTIKTIEHISITRRNVIVLNTIFKPQLPLFSQFESGRIKGFAHNMETYWGNILDYYKNMWDRTEDYAEMIEGLAQTFDSLQANKTNEIMKILTLVSAIILPLTFITGLYGMNVLLPYQEAPLSFWGIIGFMFLLAVSLTLYFKKKDWL